MIRLQILRTEEELYQRCCNYRNLKDEKVDMRNNLVVISGPSGVGKDTFEVLKARITSRKENTPAEIEHRLMVAADEIEQASKYDYVITNEDVETCVRRLTDIVNRKVL